MYKIRRDDDVIVLAGKDKGKRGKVLSRVSADRVVVQGINVAKKAVRPNPAINDAGGIVDKEMPIHVSNLALFNAAKGEKDGVRFQVVDGKKVRVYKSTGEVVKVL